MLRLPVRESAPPFPVARPSTDGAHLITLRVGRRGSPLTAAHLASEFHAALHLLALEGWWRVRCAVLLPRHAHLIATLAPGSGLESAVQELKRRLAPCLRRAGVNWDANHLARPLEHPAEMADAFRTLYREPQSAGLCAEGEAWPGYLCADDDRAWLGAERNAG
jgi:REP element-mobilizing transposase RayT